MNDNRCHICGCEAAIKLIPDPVKYCISCPVCGRYEYYPGYADIKDYNLNHLSAFLAYNGFKSDNDTSKWYSTLDKEKCAVHKSEYDSGKKQCYPISLDKEVIENWYPRTFSEKIDNILLYFADRAKYLGQEVFLSMRELYSVFFVERYEYIDSKCQERSLEDLVIQLSYLSRYFKEQNLLLFDELSGRLQGISINPSAYARIDILQKKLSTGKNVFVAMEFGDNTKTKALREAIRAGIVDAKYNPIFIDEIEHNDFITPELLKYIKDCKFMVVDLSHLNNGAYLEEGYAMGLGKPIIQLCKKGVKLHFDIAQKNTIIWEKEEDIPERLTKRINASIE